MQVQQMQDERKHGRGIKWLALLLVLLVSLGAGVFYRLHQFIHPKAETIKSQLQYDKLSGKINILVAGEDDVEGSHRSDMMALVAVDIDGRNVRVLSLPRDTRVQLEGHGWQKLNAAFAYGGVDLLKQTVEQFLGIPVHYYAVMSFGSFPQLIDQIGGVDLTVDRRLHYIDRAGHLFIDIPAGRQHLNGKTALEYVRFRHDPLGDIGRIQRQQKFFKALLEALHRPENIRRLPEIAKNMASCVSTDLTPEQAFQLAAYVKDLDPGRIFFGVMKGEPAYIGGVSYWIADAASASQFLTVSPDFLLASSDNYPRIRQSESGEQAVQPTMDPPITTASDVISAEQSASISSSRKQEGHPISLTQVMAEVKNLDDSISVLNGDGSAGICQKAAEYLQRMGIDVAYLGNGRHFDYLYSNILYPEKATDSQMKMVHLLAKICGINNNLINPSANTRYTTLILGHDYADVLRRLVKICSTI